MQKQSIIKIRVLTGVSIFSIFVITLLGTSNSEAATSVVDDVTVTVPASCTMSSIVNSNHTATVEVGSYVDDIGETTFKVVCNDAEGFSVYAVGYTNDAFGNTTMKPSVVADADAIATGTATSGDTSNWAMKLTAVTGDYAPTLETGFNAYHAVPAEYAKVASYSANTDSSSGSSFKSTYAAYVASAQPADTYTGKVKYTVVHPSNADAHPVSIEIAMSQAGKNKSTQGYFYMQDMSSEICDSVELIGWSGQTQLQDSRDDKLYWATKLKDGNCWMSENLDLGRTELTTDLTSENTNLYETVSAATFNDWKKTTGSNTYTAGEFILQDGADETSGVPYGTIYNIYAASAGTISGESNTSDVVYDICPAGWRLPTGGSSGEIITLKNAYSGGLLHASVENGGAAFALAGQFISGYINNKGSNGYYWSSTRYKNANMYYLGVSASSSWWAGSAYSLENSVRCVLKSSTHTLTVSYSTGVSKITINGATVANGGTISLEEGVSYIINTSFSPNYGFNGWNATSGTLGSANDRYTTYTIGTTDATLTANAVFVETNMQNLSASNCTTTASLVKDIRDGRAYTIQRLKDGKCWMMENLDLGRTNLTTSLTSANTNLVSTTTASTFNGWKKTSGTSAYNTGEFISMDGGDVISGTVYGTLYNYYAVSVGTVSGNVYGNNDVYDICPAGWRLPTGGSNGEYQTLYENYNSYELMHTSIVNGGVAFALAGNFSNTPVKQGEYGYYWSSTRDSDAIMYNMYLYPNSDVVPRGTNNRGTGSAVRCVLKNPTHNLTVSYGNGVSNVTINGIAVANGGIISLEENYPYPINITFSNSYGFGGWNATSGTLGSANDRYTTYTIGTTDATLTANAVFVETNMQNLSASNCTTTASLVKDIRDGRAYTIQRLKDGKCWMMENLDLGRTNLTTDLTSENTNLATTIAASTFNGWKSGSPSYYSGALLLIEGGDTTSGIIYGTFYNYYAASAGTISGYSSYSNATYDICPAGWRLPTGGSNGEYQTLYENYNSYELMHASIVNGGVAFALAGTSSGSSRIWQGTRGEYWSSTRNDSTQMYRLILSQSDVIPAGKEDRYFAQLIRCVLK